MANTNAPFGLKPIGRDSGGPLLTREYGKPANDTTAIFMFDPVIKAAVSIASPTGVGNPLPGVTSGQNATPGTTLWQGVSLNYGAASTLTAQYVIDSQDVIFIAQSIGATAITTASHVGKNADIKVAAGSTLTKQSAMGVDAASINTTAGLDLRLLRVSNIQPNAEGAYAILEVLIIKSEIAEDVAGV